MPAPLLSRTLDSDKIRREIAALEAEVKSAREKRDGVIRAIAERQMKIERLKSQLALVATPGAVLAHAS